MESRTMLNCVHELNDFMSQQVKSMLPYILRLKKVPELFFCLFLGDWQQEIKIKIKYCETNNGREKNKSVSIMYMSVIVNIQLNIKQYASSTIIIWHMSLYKIKIMQQSKIEPFTDLLTIYSLY